MPRISGKIHARPTLDRLVVEIDMTADMEGLGPHSPVIIMDTRTAGDALYALDLSRQGRNTGRTTRMLREAIIRALTRHSVLVVFPTEMVAHSYRDQTAEIARSLDVPHVMNLIRFRGMKHFHEHPEEAKGRIVLHDHACDAYHASGRRKSS
jgi:hypothetical protein